MSNTSNGLTWYCLAFSLLVLLGLAFVAPVHAQHTQLFEEGVVECRTGAQLAAAIANTSVYTALITSDIGLSQDDWTPYATPVLLKRNFTVLGAQVAMADWPQLDMAYLKAKILLGPGTLLNFSRLVVIRSRGVPPFQPVGLDILASSDVSGGAGGALDEVGPHAGIVASWGIVNLWRTCLPPSQYLLLLSTWPRPAALPGVQLAEPNITNPVPGPCVNDTSARLMRRCWPVIGVNRNLAVNGLDTNANDKAIPAGYLILAVDFYYVCQTVITEDCIGMYGPVGCYVRTVSAMIEPPPSRPRLPPLPPSPPLLAPPPAQLQGATGGKEVPLAPVLAAAIGGAFVVVVCVAAAVVWRRRRQAAGLSAAKLGGDDQGAPVPSSNTTASSTSVKLNGVPPPGLQTKTVKASAALAGSTTGSGDQVAVHTAVPAAPLRLTAEELRMLPVTPLTPFAPDIHLAIKMVPQGPDSDRTSGGNSSSTSGPCTVRSGGVTSGTESGGGGDGDARVELSATVLGKGAFGKVMVGTYRGQRVAVKLLNTGLAVAPEVRVAPDQALVAAQYSSIGPSVDQALRPADAEFSKPAPALQAVAMAPTSAEPEPQPQQAAPQASPPASASAQTGTGGASSALDSSLLVRPMARPPRPQPQPQKWRWGVVQAAAMAVAPRFAVQCRLADAAPAEAGAPCPQAGVACPDSVQIALDAAGGDPATQAVPPSERQTEPEWRLKEESKHNTKEEKAMEAVAAAIDAKGIGSEAAAALSTLAQEVEVLARCRHANVVRLLAANLAPPRVCLVMELMDTSLDKLLHGNREAGEAGRTLPLGKVLHIALQVARALSYLHPTVLHRDLKPANVLVSNPDSDTPVVKIADFGLSRLRNTVLVTRHPMVGTAPYMAPEVFDLSNTIITDRVDVWAFGVILWEMLTGQRPWAGVEPVQIACAIHVRGARLPLESLSFGRCPPRLRSLLLACWEHVPERRPAAADLVKALAMAQEVLGRSEQSPVTSSNDSAAATVWV